MAEWQSEPLYSPLCGQPWWPGGHRIPNSVECRALHWFCQNPAARGHGFRQGGLTLGQVFLITPIRARAQGALRRHLACPHTGGVISPCYPRPDQWEKPLLKAGDRAY